MKWLQHHTQVEDKAIPDLLLKGLPIVGVGLHYPFFDADPAPPAITLPHLLMGAPAEKGSTSKLYVKTVTQYTG
eukprot:6455905-Amphidinium_carterae.3